RREDNYDPYKNSEGGVHTIRRKMNGYNGNHPLVLAPYTPGEQAGAVYRRVPPYGETRRYVARILRRIGHREASPVGTRATGRAPEVVTVANPDRIAGPAREALERRTRMEIDRRPAAPSSGGRQSGDDQPDAAASHLDRPGLQGP